MGDKDEQDSESWDCSVNGYVSNLDKYPDMYVNRPNYDKSKKGLWSAICDFLLDHPEWRLLCRYYNNHGFTVLERVTSSDSI